MVTADRLGWILISIGTNLKLVQMVACCYGLKKNQFCPFLNLEARDILFLKIYDFLNF